MSGGDFSIIGIGWGATLGLINIFLLSEDAGLEPPLIEAIPAPASESSPILFLEPDGIKLLKLSASFGSGCSALSLGTDLTLETEIGFPIMLS
jgi:hypothetical protein